MKSKKKGGGKIKSSTTQVWIKLLTDLMIGIGTKCRKGHNTSGPYGRTSDGRCRVCKHQRDAKYRKTEKGQKVYRKMKWKENFKRLNKSIENRENKIQLLEERLIEIERFINAEER